MWPFKNKEEAKIEETKKEKEEAKIEETKKEAVLSVYYTDKTSSIHRSGVENAGVFNAMAEWWGNEDNGPYFTGVMPSGELYFLRRDTIIHMWVNVG